MTHPIISVRNLGKRYRLGSRSGHDTLRDHIAHGLKRLFKRRDAETNIADEEFWALKDTSFDIEKGDVVGIIGRNGAGKSTLLKILSQITEPTEGEVRIRGRVASLLEVGTGFHPELSGRENIYLNGAILGMTKVEIQRKFDEIVAFSEAGKFLDTPVKRYSSGMYVRLAFAIAAHLEPEILIVDEVLAVGDTQFQAKCMGKMNEVASGGRTVLFVSHNLAAVRQLCGKALLIQSGRLVANGPTDTVIPLYIGDNAEQNAGSIELAAHPARESWRQPWIVRLSLRSTSGAVTNQFKTFDAMIAELEIDPPREIKEPRIALAIEDSYGRRLTSVASYMGGPGFGPITGKTSVECRIPSLNLGAGRYMISVSISERYSGLLDSLNCIAGIDITSDNIYGNGTPFNPVFGPIITEASWKVI